MRLIAPLLLLLLLMFAGAASAGVTWDGSKIVIASSTENLTSVNASIANTSRIEELSAKNWLLKVPVQVETTGTLYINDSDCDWLKMLSMNDSNEAWIRNFGVLEINNTKITSWNTSANDFAPLPDDCVTTRSYIYSDSTMNIYNSNVSYLGDGTDWRSKGVTIWIADQFRISNSTFFHNFIGIRAYNVTNSVIEDCTIKRTKEYGIRIEHSSSDNITFNNNTVIDNYGEVRFEGGNHTITNNTIYAVDVDGDGIDIKGWYCAVRDNKIFNCSPHGAIDLHSFSNIPVHSNIIEYNTLYNLGAAYGSHAIYVHNEGAYNNTIRHNTMWNISSDDVVIGPYTHNNTFLNNTGDGTFSVYNAWNNNVSECDFEKFYAGSKLIISDTNTSHDNIFLNNIGNYEMENKNGVGENTVRNPSNCNYTVYIMDVNDTIEMEFTDGAVFSENFAADDVRYYHDRSNITLTGIGTTTLLKYNITLVPTSAYLKNVTVNRESNSTYDITNITVNSSVSSNPTWINATMQNASANYSVSVDSSIVDYVDADSDGIARYQYTSSWSPHDFEFNWVDQGAFSPDHTKSYYNATSPILYTVNSTGYTKYDRTLGWDDTVCSSGNLKVTT